MIDSCKVVLQVETLRNKTRGISRIIEHGGDMRGFLPGLMAVICVCGHSFAASPLNGTFDFTGKDSGAVSVRTAQSFDMRRGYGFEPRGTHAPVVGAVASHSFVPHTDLKFTRDGVTGDGPFAFSLAVPEGDYRVHVVLSCSGPCALKAEARRLLWTGSAEYAGKQQIVDRIVNVRSPMLPAPPDNAPGGIMIRLNPREHGSTNWDQKLTLEFFGKNIRIEKISVSHVDVPRVFLMGDSTVTDQPAEPYASWGQMLPYFFKNTVSVANYAESGETLKSFLAGLRLDKVLSEMRPGDYALIQFAHNDEKSDWPQTHAPADSTYPIYLHAYITEVRRHGGIPVLVTPMARMQFDASGQLKHTHGGYPDAIRAQAKADDVPLIDLNTMSRILLEALGPAGAPHAFAGEGMDHTHQSNYGGYELARCIVSAMQALPVGLKSELKDVPAFDPAQPDAPQKVQILYP